MASKEFWDETFKALQSLTDEEFEQTLIESGYYDCPFEDEELNKKAELNKKDLQK